jgi:predicted  nucleic acid-binding Zn-ribbon protein
MKNKIDKTISLIRDTYSFGDDITNLNNEITNLKDRIQELQDENEELKRDILYLESKNNEYSDSIRRNDPDYWMRE